MKVLKHLILVFLCFVIFFNSPASFAQTSGIRIIVNHQKLDLDIPPVIQDGRTLVPIRGVLEALDFLVRWDNTNRAVLVFQYGRKIEFKINHTAAKVDGQKVVLDVPPLLQSGRTLVPLRFLCDTFDLDIRWDGSTRTILIAKPLPSASRSGSVHGKTPILSPASATVKQAQAWARTKGATQTFINLAPLYWRLCHESGVDPAVAYAQSAKETGFGKFGGVINESFYNPCGMKTSKGGSNADPQAHMRFPDWETGILAHLDHLALYAGAKGYPKADSPDPRHFSYVYGRAKYVEDLGGTWAPSSNYGTSIVNNLLKVLQNT